MPRCGYCGEEFEKKIFFKHQWAEHREAMLERSATSRQKRRGNKPPEEQVDKPGAVRKLTLSPVNAALVQFATQTMVVPNTPSLLYGFLCAKKFGFKGDLALFLQEVIDDFYLRRQTNYFEEVMGWSEIGTALEPEAAAPAQPSDQQAPLPTGTGAR